jgi:hypothetical protein
MDRRGKAAPDLLEVLQYARACPIHIGTVLEHHEHVRVPEHGLGAHGLDVRCGKESRHDRIAHLVLDDIGRLIPGCVDDHLHVRYVRQGVEGNPAHAPQAGEQQNERSSEDEEAVARAPIDPKGDPHTPPSALMENCFWAMV